MTDNQFIKYQRIPHLEEVPHILDNPVEIYEKIDGGNAQVRKIGGRIFCGSRAHFLTREKLFTQEWFKDFQKWALGNQSFYGLLEDLVIYGEWTAKHTLTYKPEFTNRFFLLDVLDLNSRRFIPYAEARQILSDLGIENLLYLENLSEGKVSREQLVKMLTGNEYRYSGEREGLVVKNYELQEFAKLRASSIRRKGIITASDIGNIIHGLKDSGKDITENRVVDELELDFRRSNRQVPLSVIQSSVSNYFKKNPDN
ncbi:MAG: RNA ligase family protein [Nanoarchaeota archaeon]|nr:RNA ligase family protein [Nanoarchaeota archaeon]